MLFILRVQYPLLLSSPPLHAQHVSYFARRIDVTNPYALADFAASLTTADAKDLQVLIVARERGMGVLCYLSLYEREV